MLTNFDTNHEEDLYRVNVLRSLGYDPYIMIFNKAHAPKITKHLQRYVNAKPVFYSTTWEEYLETRKGGEEE